VTEPMTDERLAEIEACAENYNGILVTERPNSAIAHRVELLAEVKRLRDLRTPIFVTQPADTVTPAQVDEFKAAWQEMLEQPQKVIVLPSQAEQWNAAEYLIGVDSADDSHDWVYVQHLPCETDVYSGRDDRELYTADRLVELMLSHHCDSTALPAEPRSCDYPMGG